MKRACVRFDIYIFFAILLFISCGTPEEYAIHPIGKDSALKVSSIDTIKLASEKQGPHTYLIEIKAMSFSPRELKVHTGDTVLWNNRDPVTHCVTEDPGKEWASSDIPSGGSWKMVVKKSTGYYCAIHQVMKGKITVE